MSATTGQWHKGCVSANLKSVHDDDSLNTEGSDETAYVGG